MKWSESSFEYNSERIGAWVIKNEISELQHKGENEFFLGLTYYAFCYKKSILMEQLYVVFKVT